MHNFTLKKFSYLDLCLFFQVCNALIENKRYKEFDDLSLFGMMCPVFQQNEETVKVSSVN